MGASISRNGETMGQCLARRRVEWAANSEHANEQRRLDYQTRKDELNKRRREQEALNRDKIRKQLRDSYARNSNSHTRKEAATHQHKKRKLRIPSWCERDAIQEFYLNCPSGHEVDHVIPLLGKNVSGLHVLSNLQYLPMEKNRAKKNHYEVE